MSLNINNNIQSLLQNHLRINNNRLNTALERLSSGLRVNRASDDVAAMAIGNRLNVESSSLSQASRNASSTISLLQTADSTISESITRVGRIRELAIQAGNATLSSSDRDNLQKEVASLKNELSRIADTTTFGGKKLLDGSFNNQSFQIGSHQNEFINLSIDNIEASAMGNFKISSNTSSGALGAPTAAAATKAANHFAAQTLTLNGNAIATTDTISAGSSAKQIANTINTHTETTGISTTASTTAILSNLSADGTVSFNLYGSNTTAASISATVTTTDLSNLRDAINAKTATTGITATSDTNGKLTLTSNQGDDVALEDFQNSTAGDQTIDFGNETTTVALTDNGTTDSSTIGGIVQFNDQDGYSVATDTGTTLLSSSTVTATLDPVSSIDISTTSGASDAIAVADSALDTLNAIQSELGAHQNALLSTVTSLESTITHLESAKSQLLDADIAAEVAALTRAQIINQAGLSALKIAHTTSFDVLGLLSDK